VNYAYSTHIAVDNLLTLAGFYRGLIDSFALISLFSYHSFLNYIIVSIIDSIIDSIIKCKHTASSMRTKAKEHTPFPKGIRPDTPGQQPFNTPPFACHF